MTCDCYLCRRQSNFSCCWLAGFMAWSLTALFSETFRASFMKCRPKWTAPIWHRRNVMAETSLEPAETSGEQYLNIKLLQCMIQHITGVYLHIIHVNKVTVWYHKTNYLLNVQQNATVAELLYSCHYCQCTLPRHFHQMALGPGREATGPATCSFISIWKQCSWQAAHSYSMAHSSVKWLVACQMYNATFELPYGHQTR